MQGLSDLDQPVAHAGDGRVQSGDQLADSAARDLVALLDPWEQSEQRSWEEHGGHVLGLDDDGLDAPDLGERIRDHLPRNALVGAVPELAGGRPERDPDRVECVASQGFAQD